MTAAEPATKRGTPAAPQVVLRVEVFDALMAGLGATNDVERARILKINRATLYRLRTRQFTPSMNVAMRMATTLHTTVDHLFEQVAA